MARFNLCFWPRMFSVCENCRRDDMGLVFSLFVGADYAGKLDGMRWSMEQKRFLSRGLHRFLWVYAHGDNGFDSGDGEKSAGHASPDIWLDFYGGYVDLEHPSGFDCVCGSGCAFVLHGPGADSSIFSAMGQNCGVEYIVYGHILWHSGDHIMDCPKRICKEGGNRAVKIEVENLTKQLGGRAVLQDVSCEFVSGSIYGIVGHNGSGKTMLMSAIAGLIHPTQGRVVVDGSVVGKDISFPREMGLMIEKPEFLGYLSGLDNLKLLAEIRGVISEEEIRRYMRMFALDPDSRQKVRKYSLGMKQKLGIIQALMEEPRLLILDEPFNALDQDSVEMLRRLLLAYKEEGRLITLTSHHPEDIKSVCDETIRLEEGRRV